MWVEGFGRAGGVRWIERWMCKKKNGWVGRGQVDNKTDDY